MRLHILCAVGEKIHTHNLSFIRLINLFIKLIVSCLRAADCGLLVRNRQFFSEPSPGLMIFNGETPPSETGTKKRGEKRE